MESAAFLLVAHTLHRFPKKNPFDHRRRLSDLDYITSSKAAMTSLAENHVGLPMDVTI
jgi:p-hydroxybenzoate 3-monooxygenase